MASFQEKIGWDWPKNRGKKKKKNVPMSSYLTRNRELKKKSAKKFKKLKNTIMASIQAQIRWERLRRSENKKNSKKIKKLKNTIMASFHARIGCKRMRKRKNKNYRSVSFKLDVQ